MKINLFLTDPLYNVHRVLRRRASDYDRFGRKNIADMVNMYGDHIKLGARAHIFCSLVQFSLGAKDVFASTKNVTFQDSKSNEHVREEALFYQHKEGLAYARDV